MGLVSDNNLTVVPKNVATTLHEPFNASSIGNWNVVLDANDLMLYDGNMGGASYLVISKDPFSTDTETSITTNNSYRPPLDIVAGLHLSQRVVGQEAYFELISTETPSTPTIPSYGITIASIQQATTILTVITTAPHNLTVGDRIGINGVVEDTRLNYPAINIASVINPTTFTVTTGTSGSIPATISSGPFATGIVYARPTMNNAYNGAAQVYDNAVAGNASIYVRSKGGTIFTTGTLATTHAIAISSTASIATSTVLGGYSFYPTAEYRLNFQEDRIQFSDTGVDSILAQNNRHLRTQVIPDTTVDYKLRFRLNNVKSLTIPGAEVVSATKPGTNVATVVTATAHGLITGDWVNLLGQRDVVNFAYTPTLLPVTVIDTVTFSVAYGAVATGTITTYGGYVTKVQGSNLPVGFNQLAIQTASVISGLVNLTTAATVGGGLAVGDYVNLYGVRANLTGVSLGIDGRYKVYNLFTTNLVLEPIDGSIVDFAITDCGGAVIKRTDLRLSYARISDYTRERIEIASRPTGDYSIAQNISSITLVSTVSTVSTANLNTNNIVVDVASGAITATPASVAIAQSSGQLSCEINVMVTAISGTSAALDFTLQESDDTGVNWYDVYQLPRITAVGQYRMPLIPSSGNRLRYIQTVTGTTPSITRSVNRLQSHTVSPYRRQFINNSALAIGTLNTTWQTGSTSFLHIDGCSNLNLFVTMGAVTTAPVLVLEVSQDTSSWFQVGADLTTVISTNSLLQVSNVLGRFARVRVKTAGALGTGTFVLMIKGQE